MKTLIFACEVLRKEIEFLLGGLENSPQIIFTESALHEVPNKMKLVLQENLNNVPSDVGRVLFAYGLCGGSMNELQIGNYELILPRADDCIPLLLGSRARFLEENKIPTFFLTGGWADFTSEIFNDTVKRMGEKNAEKVYKLMLINYKRYLYIDTGFGSFQEDMAKMDGRQKFSPLKVEKTKGDLAWLKELVLGPWPEGKYFTFQPNSIISSSLI